MNTRCISLILLLLCCAVPLASAGGMAKIYLSPAEASWKTGQTVQVTVMYDNNLNPVAKDISLYFDWNAEMLQYESTVFKVGHTTVAGLISAHELNLLLGDFTDGYKNGDYALAVITFKVIGPGDTPILTKVARLNDMEGNPAKFVAAKGTYSIAGAAVGTVAKPTTQPAGQTVIVVTPLTTYTLIPTIAQSTGLKPAVVATTLPLVQPVKTAQAGGAPGWPVLNPGATVPTPYPTTIETTLPTAVPTTVVTTALTTIPVTFPTTTARTTFPTPTPEPITVETTWPTATATTSSQIAYQTGNLGVAGGVAINETPTPIETPTTLRTLPQPIANTSFLTEEPTEAWPLDQTPTPLPTPYVRSTLKSSAVNNTSTALAASGGSGFGDAWIFAVAAIAGVAIVALGIVVVRRGRDDDL
jgi:hypothetical protein